MTLNLDDIFTPAPDIFLRESTLAQGLVVGEAYEITEEDLLELESVPKGATTAPLVKLRASHHALARLLATGVKQADAARMLGMCQSRISILKNDPSFKDLIEHYAGVQELAFAGMQQKLAAVGADSLEVLHERVLDDADKITTETLVKIVEMTADRTGHGKQSNINVKSLALTGEDLARIKESQNENVIQISQADRAALIRQIPRKEAGPDTGSETADGAESSGASL